MLEMESWEVMLGQLGMYFLTVMIGLFIHGFVVLQLIFFVVTRKLPFRYVGNLSEALATAFATSSRSVINDSCSTYDTNYKHMSQQIDEFPFFFG